MKGDWPRVVVLVPLVGAMMLSTPRASQVQPDFSGRWVLESVAHSADVPTALVVHQSLARTNVRGEPITPFVKDLTVIRESPGGNSSETFRIGTIGGTVPGSNRGPTSHRRVVWANTTLVIETGTFTGSAPERGEWTQRREVWAADSEGHLQVSITQSSSTEAPHTATFVYRRAEIGSPQ